MDKKTLYDSMKNLTNGTSVRVEEPVIFEDEMQNGCAKAVANYAADKPIYDCYGDAKVLRYDDKARVLVCQDKDENGVYNVEIPFDAYSIQEFVPKYLRVNRRVGFYIVNKRVDETTGETIYIGDRRALQEQYLENTFGKYAVRDSIIFARITKVTKASIFLDMGYGLASCLSVVTLNVIGDSCVSRVAYNVGDVLAVVLLEPIRADNAIIVSQRELLGTWEDNVSLLTTGDVLCGVVSSVCDFGTFVALTENVFGLTETTTTVVPGQYVSVSINRIIADKHKIKLGLVSENCKCNGGECVSKRTQYFIKSYCDNVSKNGDRWCYFPEKNKRYDTQFCFEQRSNKYPRTYRASVAVCADLDAQYKE